MSSFQVLFRYCPQDSTDPTVVWQMFPTEATKSGRRVDKGLEPSPREPKLDSIFGQIMNSADLHSLGARPWQVDDDFYEPLAIETARLIPILPVNAKLVSIGRPSDSKCGKVVPSRPTSTVHRSVPLRHKKSSNCLALSSSNKSP